MSDTNIGRCLKIGLTLRDMSQTDLAERLGVSRQTVNYWTKGQQMTAGNMLNICNVLGMEPSEFIKLDRL